MSNLSGGEGVSAPTREPAGKAPHSPHLRPGSGNILEGRVMGRGERIPGVTFRDYPSLGNHFGLIPTARLGDISLRPRAPLRPMSTKSVNRVSTVPASSWRVLPEQAIKDRTLSATRTSPFTAFHQPSRRREELVDQQQQQIQHGSILNSLRPPIRRRTRRHNQRYLSQMRTVTSPGRGGYEFRHRTLAIGQGTRGAIEGATQKFRPQLRPRSGLRALPSGR
jgi:hypothetical protein